MVLILHVDKLFEILNLNFSARKYNETEFALKCFSSSHKINSDMRNFTWFLFLLAVANF